MRTEAPLIAVSPRPETSVLGFVWAWFRDTGWKHLLLIGFGCIMTYPLVYMLTGSFLHNQRFATELRGEFTLENYIKGWSSLGIPFGRFMLTR